MISYSMAAQMAQLITVVAGILSRNFLGPTQMGIWATLQVILTYSSYSALGTSAGIARQVPFYLGRKDEAKAAEIKNLVFSYQTGLSVLTSIGFLIFAFLLRSKLNQALFWGLLGAGFLLVLQRVNGIQISVLRAYKKFDVASRLALWSAAVNLFLILLLAPFFHFFGFVAAMVLSFIFNIVYSARCFPFHFKFMLNPEIKKILSFAFPLMVFGMAESFFKTIDKLVIVKTLGFEQMGFYSIAIMFSNFLAQIPNSMSIVMVPHFEEKYGQNEQIHDVFPYVEKSLQGLSFSMMILIGAAWVVTPFFVNLLMPAYGKGIMAAQFLILSSYFLALTMPYSTVLVTLRKQIYLLPLIGIVIAVSTCLNLAVIKLGFGINGVAAAMIFSFFFYFLSFHFMTNHFFFKASRSRVSLKGITLHFAYLALVLGLIDFFWRYQSGTLKILVYQMGLFFVLMSPILFILHQRYDVFSVFRGLLRRKKPSRPQEIEKSNIETEIENTGSI